MTRGAAEGVIGRHVSRDLHASLAPEDEGSDVKARWRSSTPSTESGPDPPRTRAARHARYNKSTSYPGGPNCGPAVVTARSLIELNPYGRCTVSAATTTTAAIGRPASHTKAPPNTERPPSNSIPMVAHAMKS